MDGTALTRAQSLRENDDAPVVAALVVAVVVGGTHGDGGWCY